MSRPVRRHTISVSLFPFLAVLICIMGALVILLVLMVARVGAGVQMVASSQPGAQLPADGSDGKELRERLEDAQWRREMLEKSRSEKTQELADRRAELSHLEDHIQRLGTQVKEVFERAHQIDERKQLREEDLAAARSELARLKDAAAQKKKELDEKQQREQSQDRWYALIPYDGPHSTRRRPIYIECTEAGITIQPEGLTFVISDFRGPLGPGNPLDAALRTIRERLAQGGGKAGEPYPLLVVRPGGTVAYGAARAALQAWDDEFGYELISDEKKLTFGEPDPTLAAELDRTVFLARRRQSLLAAAMPRRFVSGDSPTSFGDESGSDAQPGGFASGGYGGGSGGGGSAGVGSGGGGTGGNGGSVGTAGAARGVGGTSGSGGSGTGNSPGQGARSGSAAGGTTGRYGGSGLPGSGTSGGAGGSSASGISGGGVSGGGGFGSAAGAGGGGFGGGSAGGQSGGGTGSAGGGTLGGNGGFGQPGGPGSAGSPGTFVPLPNSGAGGGGSAAAGSTGQAGGGAAAGGGPRGGAKSGGGPGGSSGSGGPASGGSKSKLARGSNWGLPGARPHSIGVTRPIRVTVLRDRLLLVPEKGDDRPVQQIPISPRLAPQDVDALVTAVQREMKGWGLAVENGYWKPQLLMEVAPDAEEHYGDLKIALEGSGFDLQRKLR